MKGFLSGSTAASGRIIGEISAICFQDAPISALSQNYYYKAKLREINICPVKCNLSKMSE